MGPTASGKTDLAIELAGRLDCELVSVDSVLVYRGMDIGTAKPDYPHHLVDIRDPADSYSAADFARDARHAVAEIAARGRTPLLVGFAAETEDVIANARKKLAQKKCDLIVANDVSEPNAGFAVDTNHVQLVDADDVVDVPSAPKSEVAHRILDKIGAMLAESALPRARAISARSARKQAVAAKRKKR